VTAYYHTDFPDDRTTKDAWNPKMGVPSTLTCVAYEILFKIASFTSQHLLFTVSSTADNSCDAWTERFTNI